MEDLLPFLFFLVVGILTAIGKAQAKKKKKNKTKQKDGGGLFTRLNALLADMQKRLEAQSKAGTASGQSGWEQLMGRGDRGDTQPVLYEGESLDDLVLEEVDQPPEPPRPKPAPQQRTPRIKPTGKSKPPPEPEQDDQRPQPAVIPKTRADLRRAVVWAEVIGPPVALREPDETL